jgi:hypothetical protein
MTKDEIVNMPAGRELDRVIAGKVMGWEKEIAIQTGGARIIYFKDGDKIRTIEPTSYGSFQPSTDIAASWDVVNKIIEDAGKDIEIKTVFCRDFNVKIFNDGECWADVTCNSVSQAICRAALLTVMDS